MKILVVGATGVLGRNVIPRLLERGHAVRAIVLRPEERPFLEHAGAEAVIGNIFDLDSLNQAAQGCEAALHLATAVPKSGSGDWSLNDRIRREGTEKFMTAAANNGVRQYIQQSIILVYGDNGPAKVDESAPLQPVPLGQSAVDMETLVRGSGFDWCILRAGMFYGPITGQETGWRQAARDNRLMLPGDGSDFISLVRVVDMARAVVAATESASPGSTYNIVDDEPVRFGELFNYVAARENAGPLQAGGPKFLPSLRCSNTRAKQELPWQPLYPTYRSGLVG